MCKVILLMMILSLIIVNEGSEKVNAAVMLNGYGRIPNKVATCYGANGGPARNNSSGYLWRK